MKKVRLLSQIVLSVLFIFFLYVTILDLTNNGGLFSRFNHLPFKYEGKEEYDSTLSRLNSLKVLNQYCDSLYEAQFGNAPIATNEGSYTDIVNSVIRKKFYHGYSSYGYGDNYAALMFEPLTGFWASAIVIPDDIVKYPFAACSQQSIVLMEMLRSKGITSRKVGFDGKEWGGHFCVEAYYNDSWHFYDPNREPDSKILTALHRPSIEEIAKQDALLLSLYKNMPNAQVLSTYKNYFYGQPNTFEAPRARVYQSATRILSYIMWVVPLLILLLFYRKYLRLSSITHVWNSRVYFPRFTKKGSPAYNGNSGS